MRQTIRALLMMLFVGVVGTSQAALQLELTQGVDAAIPIALVPFAGVKNAPTDVSAVISADLNHSGQFSVLGASAFKQAPHDPDAVNYSYWRQLGANNVVVGEIKPSGANHFSVTAALLSVASKNVIFNKTFTVRAKSLRALSHHISDRIYQALTGVKGVFSTRIAYVLVKRASGKSTQYKLMVADVDGLNAQAILTSPQPIMSPTWSPDGTHVAYVSFENQRSQIYISDISTGKRRLVSSFPGINGAPAWSPNGKQLAFVLSKESGKTKVYVMDISDKHLTQVTTGLSIDTEPAWAPDGKSLIFTSNRGGTPQIYQVNLATKKVTRLSFEGNYNARPAFTPDGKSIVMLHREEGLFNIAVQNLQTVVVSNLTQTGLEKSPSIAPNGKMALFASHFGGRGVLGMVSLDGRIKLRLPAEAGGDVQEPAWSPYLF